MNKDLQTIFHFGLIAIMRDLEEEQLLPVAEALKNGGVRVVEIAFNPADENTVEKTAAAIQKVSSAFRGELLVGAGTVVKPAFVTAAYEAGARFIFSPNTDKEIIRLTKTLGLISIPGALTPSECMAAWNAGADLIKLFPITAGQVDYVTNIMRPLSNIPFICVGGTNLETVPLFIKAGAVGVGTGLSILKPELLAKKDYKAIEQLAAAHQQAVLLAKGAKA